MTDDAPTPSSDPLVDRLIPWASRNDLVRAVLLTSSRTNPDSILDEFSDHDVVLVVSNRAPFDESDDWLRWLAEPLVLFRNRQFRDGVEYDMCLVMYTGGIKVDYCIWRPQDLALVAAQPRPRDLDLGYRVLLDKDGLTSGLPPPTRTAFIPQKPTQREFELLVEEFWWETTYVAKYLRRDELFQAKYSFDSVIKFDVLRTMLEWLIQVDRDWSLNSGVHGRRFKQLLPPDVWREVEKTFVGAGAEENWRALWQTMRVFRDAAIKVAAALGLEYPHTLDVGVTAYLRGMRPREFAGDD